jgi:hypothetical protein
VNAPRAKPPCDPEAEQATLGAMLLERGAALAAVGLLTAGDFYHEPHQRIFAVFADLATAGPFDLVTARSAFLERGELEAVGGHTYLAELQATAASAGMARHYAETVRRCAIRRRRWLAALRFTQDPQDVEAELALADAFADSERLAEAASWAEVADTSPEVAWLVDGVAFRGGLTILSGPGGAGKSYLALTLAHAVATGTHWLGHFPTEDRGPALYVDAERGRHLMARRLREVESAAGRPLGVDFIFRPPKLDAAFLRAAVRDRKPALVVLDSLSRLLPEGADENSNPAMTAALEPVRLIAEEFSTALLVLHHDRKPQAFADNSGAARVRGASAIVNLADIVVCASQDPEGRVLVQTAKTWFGDPLPAFAARFTADPEGGATVLLYDSDLETRAMKKDLARKIALDALAQGPRTQRELLALGKREGISDRWVRDTLTELEKAGHVKADFAGRERTWQLA